MIYLLTIAVILGLWVAPFTPKLYTQAPLVTTEASAPIPTVSTTIPPKVQKEAVKASWYGVKEYCEKYNPSCIMANGIKLEDDMFIAACDKKWSLGTLLQISHGEKSVIVSCTDRGNFAKYGRMLDLSKAAFESLAPLSKGVIEVEVL